jgi:hypothetical protein
VGEHGRYAARTALISTVLAAIAFAACSESSPALVPPSDAASGNSIQHVFVIAMENADAADVYDTANWAYLDHQLLPQAARALTFQDELPIGVPSEPHYVWMEAGTNAFADHTFTDDDPPSASNSTSDPNHLVTQLAQAENGADWMSYQEGLDAGTGACPLAGDGFYRPNHDPFLFFRDIAGTPPSKTAVACVAHHRALSALAGDLAAGSVSAYNFITPNLCHDGHGALGCPSSNLAQAADQWLEQTLPSLIAFANANGGAIFLVWDEGASSRLLPFVAVGAHVKPGYAGNVTYSHSSLLKSLEEILGVPILPSVSSANDFGDLFAAGTFP